MRKKIADTYKRSSIGTCTLWREDITTLIELLKRYSTHGVSIASGKYEYDTVEELFSSFGPTIPRLQLSTRDPEITINLWPSGSYFFVDVGHSPGNALEGIYSEVVEFFRDRWSLERVLSHLFVICAVPLVLFASIRGLTWFAPDGMLRSISILTLDILVIGFAALVLTSLSMGGIINSVALRNRSKIESQFNAEDRRKRNFERLAFAVVGALLALLVQLFLQRLKS